MTAAGAAQTDFEHGLQRDFKSYVEFNEQATKYFRVHQHWLASAKVNVLPLV
jgi:hypothetical protein